MWNIQKAKWISIWWNEHSRKKKGWVIMKSKCANVNECGDNMMWGQCKRLEQSQMSLCKSYQNVLTYESVKLISRPVFTNTLMKVLRLTHLILMMRWETNYWAMMSSY